MMAINPLILDDKLEALNSIFICKILNENFYENTKQDLKLHMKD